MAETALCLEKTTRDILLDAADHIVATKGVARLTHGSAQPGQPRANDDKIVMLRHPGGTLERVAG
jgi:hypothetical protein